MLGTKIKKGSDTGEHFNRLSCLYSKVSKLNNFNYEYVFNDFNDNCYDL